MTEIENCNICGQSKRSDTPGTITQWMSICQCDLIEEESQEALQFCSICENRIKDNNPGSLTQWVFQEEYCECETPEPVTDQSKTTPMQVLEAVDKKPDSSEIIELDPQSFPTERYKPMAKLGAGGKGIVYLCWDEHLRKRVAVKVLLNTTEDELVSFQREAKLTAKFKHENIIEILDFGVTKNQNPFMVLKYINGIGLDVLLKRNGPCEAPLALILFIQIADALHHGHQMGIYHRDMKTSNVLLTGLEHGNPKALIIDFGVSAIIGNQDATSVQGKTLVGTPKYMPPDQAMGNVYDARSEIYSFGCLMYELLAGRPPFEGEDVLELLSKHANEPPPSFEDSLPEELLPHKDLQGIVFKCLEKEPDNRFQSMIELKESLVSLQAKLNRPPSRTFSLIDIPLPEKEEAQYTRLLTPLNVGLVMLGLASMVAFLVLLPRDLVEPEPEVFKDKTYRQKVPFAPVENVIPKKMYKIVEHDGVKRFQQANSMVFTDEHMKQIEKCTGISEVVVNGTDIDGSGLAYALKFPISYLDIRDSQINDAGMSNVGQMSKLSGLCAKRCGNLTDLGLKKIARLPIRFLMIDNNDGFTNESMETISQLKELRQLNMEQTRKIDAQGLNMLQKLPNLEALYISPKGKKLDYYKAIGKLNLKLLGIVGDSRREIIDLPVEYLKALNEGPYYLRLDGMVIKSEHIKALSEFKNLRLLHLANNKITNALMDDVKSLPLLGINLVNQEIGDTGLVKVAQMKKLKTLVITGNKFVSKKSILELKKIRPDIQIIENNYYALTKNYSPYKPHPDWK